MFKAIKNIFKKKSKQEPLVVQDEKRTYEKKIDHSNDISFENEVKVKQAKETISETKSDTKSGLGG
jgi:hypothetical protein|tara:strand:+ start:124 stop:321 length:198 start_codon:yes stop_codon:yes gene_type:complete